MDGLEAIEMINSWRRILIEGKPESIDRTLDDVERRLREKGWARDADMEAKMGRSAERKNRWLCFIGGPRDGPRLLLCLTRVSDRRVRGGTYSLLNGPPGMQATDVAAVVEDVIKGVLKPSTSDFGLEVTIPRLGLKSRVPPRTMASLLMFSDLAGGAWPLSTQLEHIWRRFVISACREDAAFDIDELSDWFVTNGWSSEDAHALTERFISEASLITEYDDETKP
jgi:hypothetical protein